MVHLPLLYIWLLPIVYSFKINIHRNSVIQGQFRSSAGCSFQTYDIFCVFPSYINGNFFRAYNSWSCTYNRWLDVIGSEVWTNVNTSNQNIRVFQLDTLYWIVKPLPIEHFSLRRREGALSVISVQFVLIFGPMWDIKCIDYSFLWK